MKKGNSVSFTYLKGASDGNVGGVLLRTTQAMPKIMLVKLLTSVTLVSNHCQVRRYGMEISKANVLNDW